MNSIDPDPRWRWAREAYLDGGAVSGILKAYQLPRTTFYRRARREGWLRDDDQAEGRAACTPDPAPPIPDLAARALDEAARAVLDGELQAAEGWLRVVKRLRALDVPPAEPVPSERNTVEQGSAPQTEAPQRISLPAWNSSTGFSEAELEQLEAAAENPATPTGQAAQAIERLTRHYRRELETKPEAGRALEHCRTKACQGLADPGDP